MEASTATKPPPQPWPDGGEADEGAILPEFGGASPATTGVATTEEGETTKPPDKQIEENDDEDAKPAAKQDAKPVEADPKASGPKSKRRKKKRSTPYCCCDWGQECYTIQLYFKLLSDHNGKSDSRLGYMNLGFTKKEVRHGVRNLQSKLLMMQSFVRYLGMSPSRIPSQLKECVDDGVTKGRRWWRRTKDGLLEPLADDEPDVTPKTATTTKDNHDAPADTATATPDEKEQGAAGKETAQKDDADDDVAGTFVSVARHHFHTLILEAPNAKGQPTKKVKWIQPLEAELATQCGIVDPEDQWCISSSQVAASASGMGEPPPSPQQGSLYVKVPNVSRDDLWAFLHSQPVVTFSTKYCPQVPNKMLHMLFLNSCGYLFAPPSSASLSKPSTTTSETRSSLGSLTHVSDVTFDTRCGWLMIDPSRHQAVQTSIHSWSSDYVWRQFLRDQKAKKEREAQQECHGLQSSWVDDYADRGNDEFSYCALRWSHFRNAWRSAECTLLVAADVKPHGYTKRGKDRLHDGRVRCPTCLEAFCSITQDRFPELFVRAPKPNAAVFNRDFEASAISQPRKKNKKHRLFTDKPGNPNKEASIKRTAKYPNGTKFQKNFPGFGTFQGTVVGFNGEKYHVHYEEDDDWEQMDEASLERCLTKTATGTASATPLERKYPIGTTFKKNFPGHGVFEGTVYDYVGLNYQIHYKDDDDWEQMDEATLESFILESIIMGTQNNKDKTTDSDDRKPAAQTTAQTIKPTAAQPTAAQPTAAQPTRKKPPPTPTRKKPPPLPPKDSATAHGSISSVLPQKRGRGRPRKTLVAQVDYDDSIPVSPKKRGRPRKRSLESMEGINGSSSEPPKKRGRPRKHPLEITEGANSSSSEPPKKRCPGRPRKHPVEGVGPVVPKRGPGRPRKHPLEDGAPPKRGRGRPRKETREEGGEPEKRGPGRPRKHPLPAAPSQNGTANVDLGQLPDLPPFVLSSLGTTRVSFI